MSVQPINRCMASISTPVAIQMRDRIFVLPNLVLWIMVWPLAFHSDLGNVELLIPFFISLLIMSTFGIYDRMRSGGWSATMRPLGESTPITKLLAAVVLIMVVITVWYVSTYNENLSWLGWNIVAAFNLYFSYLIVPSSPNAPE
jgi:hypothetical protein